MKIFGGRVLLRGYPIDGGFRFASRLDNPSRKWDKNHMLKPSRWISILSCYISREFIKTFLLSVCAFNIIYLVIDFFTSVDRFIQNHAAVQFAIRYYVLKIPVITFQTLPLATLLSTLVTLGVLSRHNETTAMKANGISLYRIARPILVISCVIALLTFFGNEHLAPQAYRQSEHIMHVEVLQNDPKAVFKNFNLWRRSESSIYNIQAFDPESNTLKGISIYSLDKHFNLIRRVDAREATWKDSQWTLTDVTVRKFDGEGPLQVENHDRMSSDMDITPETLKRVERDTEEMGYNELKHYVRRLQRTGYDATKYIVDLQTKVAFPFVNVVMVLIGIPFALKTGRAGGFAIGIAISIGVGLCYWILVSVCRAFGHSGILPPLVSAWSPHILFGGAGVVALMSVRH